jgi:hypothetical protein
MKVSGSSHHIRTVDVAEIADVVRIVGQKRCQISQLALSMKQVEGGGARSFSLLRLAGGSSNIRFEFEGVSHFSGRLQ